MSPLANMKDLTYYFTDSTKVSESSVKDNIEVIPQRAKVIQESDGKVNLGNGTIKKRERVKIKITNNHSQDITCKIIESESDLVDKTPSPMDYSHKNRDVEHSYTPKRMRSPRMSAKKEIFSFKSNCNVSPDPKQLKEIVRLDCDSEAVMELVTTPDSENCLFNNPANNKTGTNDIPSDSNNGRKKYKEKLLNETNKKGHKKQKLIDKKENGTIQVNVDDRQKMLNNQTKKNSAENSNPLNNNEKRSSSSLLNYFSKATAEQLEIERIAMSKMVVKVDVHEGQSSVISNSSGTPILTPKKEKRCKANIKTLISQADEIQILSSERLSPLHMSSLSTKLSEKKKRNWSLQVKLNLKDNVSPELPEQNSSSDEDIFTSRIKIKQPKENKTTICYNVKKKEKNPNDEKNKTQPVRKEKKLTLKHKKLEINLGHIDMTNVKHENGSANASIIELVTFKAEEKCHMGVTDKERHESINGNEIEKKNNEEDCIIMEENVLKRKSMEKIAPLFLKRRKHSSVALQARRFLQSDNFETEGKISSSKVSQTRMFLSFFPKISHVTQLNGESTSKMCDFKSNFPLKTNSSYKASMDLNQLKYVNISSSFTNEKSVTVSEIAKNNIEDTLKEIESRCSDARLMWNKISELTEIKQIKQREKSRKDRSKKNIHDKINLTTNCGTKDLDVHNTIWTCKYRPLSSKEIIGNEEAVKKLQTWLNSWKKPIRVQDESSGDEFYSSDCSRSSELERNQVAVLLGPHGSGKTSSVYAVAEELGYSVLEVNASSKRPGKKILKDLGEATKSHRIRNVHIESFGFGSHEQSKEKETTKNSLILLDDVDVIFEEDEGFVSAVFQLATNTRRPIVMTCKERFPSLSKLAPQQLRIPFQKVTGKRVSVFLELISLAEMGFTLPPSYAQKLLQTGDLRKALLQLQYLLISGKISPSELNNAPESLWRDMQNGLYKPIVKKLHKKRKQNETMLTAQSNTSVLHNLEIGLDTVSLISKLCEFSDVALEKTDFKPKTSLSLVEDSRSYYNLNDIGKEIADWLANNVLQKKKPPEIKEITTFSNLLIEKSINEDIDLALSQNAALTLDRRAISTDYLPYIRTICRAEEIRMVNNRKRGNRFYHYLQGKTTIKPHIYTAACKMLNDKDKVD